MSGWNDWDLDQKSTSVEYAPGTRLSCHGIKGIVVENYKLPDNICIEWEDGMSSSYDLEWIEEYTILEE